MEDPRTPPAPGTATGTRQGVISGRVVVILVVSLALAVLGLWASGVFV
ncbi:hypothetical protein [Elioraea rosea]|nr:hypothetical protein [Elioraea rosea]